MNRLAVTFSNFGFSPHEVEEIVSRFTLTHYKAGDYFLKYGEFCEHIGFVEHGIFQFFCEKDAEEITTYIALKNDFIVSIHSYFAQERSKENIKALTASDLWLVSRSDFERLIEQINDFKNFYLKVLEHLLVCVDGSRLNYITMKPEERYAKLLKEEPELLQQISLKYLASLIGITPRHLSRIRGNI